MVIDPRDRSLHGDSSWEALFRFYRGIVTISSRHYHCPTSSDYNDQKPSTFDHDGILKKFSFIWIILIASSKKNIFQFHFEDILLSCNRFVMRTRWTWRIKDVLISLLGLYGRQMIEGNFLVEDDGETRNDLCITLPRILGEKDREKERERERERERNLRIYHSGAFTPAGKDELVTFEGAWDRQSRRGWSAIQRCDDAVSRVCWQPARDTNLTTTTTMF